MDKKTKKTLGTVAILATAAGVAIMAAPSISSIGGGNGSFGGGGGGSLGGFADEIDYDDSENILSLEDLLAMIPQPDPEEPTLLDEPPSYTVPESDNTVTVKQNDQTEGFWSSFFNSLNPDTKETAVKSTLSAALTLPKFAAAPLPVRIAAAGASFGGGLGTQAIQNSRDWVNRQKQIAAGHGVTPTAPGKTSTQTKTTGSSKKSGSGYGSAKIVEVVKIVTTPKKEKEYGSGGISGGFGGGGGGLR